jgi:hypothetical protein
MMSRLLRLGERGLNKKLAPPLMQVKVASLGFSDTSR